MAERERRVLLTTVEIRKAGDTPTISGYAAMFNEETVIAGMFREKIAPGAFTDAVKSDDVRALFNHDPNFVLGRTKSGTLTLTQDSRGLFYDVNPPNTQAANDVRELILRGDVDGSSFGFTVEEDAWTYPEAGSRELPLRTIRKASLFDVSPVTFPAYEATSVSARSVERAKEATRMAPVVPAAELSSERSAVEQAKAWRK